MHSLKDQTVGNIVAADYRTAEVFEKYRIDFCCQGGTTLDAACQKKQVAVKEITAELEKAIAGPEQLVHDFQAMRLDHLCDYVEKTHHSYVTASLPLLEQYLEKVTRVHGERHPELHEVYRLYQEVAQELTMHLKKEEVILFPYVRDMVSQQMMGSDFMPPHFGTVKNPIQVMEQEHDSAGDHFHQIAELTSHYAPPADACTTYRVAYAKLEEFERDLHRHVHLENNLIFPKAKELEQTLRNTL
ncbi:MAG: iron-sulfur cluster repair di-iron protein [Saprospirales bacterium]|nr:iron-sulfur cluster repair di-iron protein [Saprospirales bacterium]MBK8490472.1 iron-sulfur cluster repair di-iron protein [Saprospirales bacterium]